MIGSSNVIESTNFEDACKFTVDRTRPEAPSINSPSENQYFNSTPILNDWSEVTDESGIAYYRIEYQYDDEHTFPNAPYRTTSDGTTTQRNHTPGVNEEGGVKFRVQAFDNAGNEGTWSEWRHYYYIDSNPVVSLVSPDDNFITNQGGFVQSWSVDDFHQEHIDHYEYRSCWNNPTDENGTCDLLHGKNDLTSTSRTVGKQADKTFWWQVRAVDKAGNVGDWTGARKAILDSTPPVVDITSHQDGDILSGEVQILGTITEENMRNYNLSLNPDPEGSCNKEDTWNFSNRVWQRDGSTNTVNHTLDTTELADGSYMIRLAARDLAGNRDPMADSGSGDSVEVICVTIDNESPTAELLSSIVKAESDGVERFIQLLDNFGLQTACYNLGDGEICEDISGEGTEYLWNVSYIINSLGVGSHTFAYWVFDLAGNRSDATATTELESEDYSFNVDVEPNPEPTENGGQTGEGGNTDGTGTNDEEDTLGAQDQTTTGTTTTSTTPVPAQSPLGTGGYLYAQTTNGEEETEEEIDDTEVEDTEDVEEDKDVKGTEDENGEQEPTEEQPTKWWVYPLVILPVLAIFLILWKRRKEDNEPQF